MQSLTTIKILKDRLTLTGFSRAAEATSIYVPEMNLILDAGMVVTTSKVRRLFVTHSHSDHSYQIPYLYSTLSPIPLDVYVPQASVPHFDHYLTAAQLLNDHGDEKALSNCAKRFALHGVTEQEIIDLDGSYRVEVFRCHHTVPCNGYAFYEKRNKLKAEYAQLNGKQIQELKKQSIAVSEQINVPLFAFLGDTTPAVFAPGSHSAQVLLERMPVVICECTFLDGEQSDEKGHTHWSGIKPIIEQHPDVTFVLIHFSMKHKREEIQRFFENQALKNVIPFIWYEERCNVREGRQIKYFYWSALLDYIQNEYWFLSFVFVFTHLWNISQWERVQCRLALFRCLVRWQTTRRRRRRSRGGELDREFFRDCARDEKKVNA